MRFFWLALFLLTIGCAAVRTDRESARELSPPGDEEAFHFVVFGDRTGGPKEGINVLAAAVEETNLLDPDFVMTVGDLVQGYNQTPEWLEQMREYKATMAGLHMQWYPVAGNHDVYWRGGETPPGHHEANYEEHFGPLWYWFGHKNAAFIVLYTDEGDHSTNRKGFRTPDLVQMSAEQLDWLKGALRAGARYDQVFLFMHHPRWIEDIYFESNWGEVHQLLVEAGNVSAVFAGHIHKQRYEGRQDGILYYTLATVGGRLRMDVPGSGSQHHFDQVTVREDGFEIASIPVGTVWDPKGLTPEFLEDIEEARILPIALRTPEIELGVEGEALGTLSYDVENATTRPVEISLRIEQAPGDWLVRPNRVGLILEAGQSGEIKITLERPGDGFLTPFSIPVAVFQVDYIGADRRISLPERRLPIPLMPVALPNPAGSPPQQKAMWLQGNGSGLWLSPEALDFSSTNFTLEIRFQADDLSGDRVLIGKYDGNGIAFMLSSGRPRLVTKLGGKRLNLLAPEDNKVEAGRWYHLAAVSSATGTHLYLDGNLVATSERTGPITKNSLPLIIGGNPDHQGAVGSPFSGAIDEVRISTIDRYQEEGFTPPLRHEADADTALLLHLDRDDGPFALDASAHLRHAIGLGSPEFRPY